MSLIVAPFVLFTTAHANWNRRELWGGAGNKVPYPNQRLLNTMVLGLFIWKKIFSYVKWARSRVKDSSSNRDLASLIQAAQLVVLTSPCAATRWVNCW